MTNKSVPILAASLSFAAALLFFPSAVAAEKAAATDAAKAAYPLTTCVVSGDKLEANNMGGPVDYIYKEKGKPDRLVRFCCKDCIKDFNKEPAKYLKMLDEAATAKSTPAPKP